MPTLHVLPHRLICPKGARIEVRAGDSILDALLARRIPMDHACGKSCACASCHVIVRQGFESLDPPLEPELDMLDKAVGAESQSRLACQARISWDDITIEIPPHTAPYGR